MKDKPRIGTDNNSGRIQIYNGEYSATGDHLEHFEHPWTVYTPHTSGTFATHAEAVQWALQEAKKHAV